MRNMSSSANNILNFDLDVPPKFFFQTYHTSSTTDILGDSDNIRPVTHYRSCTPQGNRPARSEGWLCLELCTTYGIEKWSNQRSFQDPVLNAEPPRKRIKWDAVARQQRIIKVLDPSSGCRLAGAWVVEKRLSLPMTLLPLYRECLHSREVGSHGTEWSRLQVI